MPDPRHKLGRTGEQLAAEFLRRRGYRVLAANVRGRHTEADLLVESGNDLIAVEVKTTRQAYLDPLLYIGPRKQRVLRRLGLQLSGQFPARNIRFDAVTVYWKPETRSAILTHYPNILTW